MTTLFSGRFDRVSTGHIITLKRLATRYDMVKIVVLSYPEQEYCVNYRAQILREVTSGLKGMFKVYINNVHFGKITKKELDEFQPWDVYTSGNHDVLKHIEALGYRVEYVERAYDYAATDDRLMKQIKKVLSV